MKSFEAEGWFGFAPGPNPLNLALCVVSDEFHAWFIQRNEGLSDRVQRLRSMPSEKALATIRGEFFPEGGG